MIVETRELKIKKSRANLYHVPAKQWRKWTPQARQVFNEVYSQMIGNQDFFIHPKAVPASKSQWSTTCWNASWAAADAVASQI